MKYRRLTGEELEELEKEFVRFLATNSIPAGEWERLKSERPKEVERLIQVFSDLVFERTLREVRYLEFKTARDIKTFHCLPDKIVMIGLMIDGDSQLDFTAGQDPSQMLALLQLSGARLKMYTAEKHYGKERELELFDMLESGARISKDGQLYRTLASLKA